MPFFQQIPLLECCNSTPLPRKACPRWLFRYFYNYGFSIFYKSASKTLSDLPNCDKLWKTIWCLVNFLCWEQNPCSIISRFDFICTKIEDQVGRLKTVWILVLIYQFVFRNSHVQPGCIISHVEVLNIILNKKFLHFSLKRCWSIKAPNWLLFSASRLV